MSQRIDRAVRTIAAPASTLYAALTSRDAWLAWLPPAGMTATLPAFELRPGGRYEMTLRYTTPPEGGGKTTADADADTVHGHFVEFVPDTRVVQTCVFVSPDPAFAGTMTMTWALAPLSPTTTRVTFSATDVPPGISATDHEDGLRTSLAQLAAHVER